MRINISLWLLLLVCVLVGSSAADPQKSTALTAEQARALAEAFVVDNGYTDLPPNRSRIAHESIEWFSDLDKILSFRRDTVEKHAFRVEPNLKHGKPGWFVVFRYRHPRYRQDTGRAVTMDLDGSNMRMEHRDAVLKRPKSTRPKNAKSDAGKGRRP